LIELIGGDPPAAGANGNAGGNADILSDIFGGNGNPTASSPSPGPGQPPKSNINDILDLFGSGPPSGAPTPAPTTPQPSTGGGLIDGLGGLAQSQSPPPPTAGLAQLPVYSKNDLDVSIQLQRTPDGTVNVLARFRNTSFTDNISGVNLQAAVPKSQRLALQPISSSELAPASEATLMMKVIGSKGVSQLYLDSISVRF
jgi:AP-1 complex subunit gamma-1